MDGTETVDVELSLDDVMADQDPDETTSAVERFQRQGVSLVENAKSLTIVDDATYTRAGEILTLVAGLRKEITAFFSPLKSKAAAAHKAICDAEKQKLAPVAEAESAVKRALVSYESEQERKRRELEAKLREEARKAEQEARALEAAQLKEQGEVELAERVLEAPSVAPTVVLPKSTPRVAGVSFREVWSAEVTDLVALCRAIADGTQPASLVEPNTTALNGLARSLKGAMAVPGVRAVAQKVAASR